MHLVKAQIVCNVFPLQLFCIAKCKNGIRAGCYSQLFHLFHENLVELSLIKKFIVNEIMLKKFYYIIIYLRFVRFADS